MGTLSRLFLWSSSRDVDVTEKQLFALLLQNSSSCANVTEEQL